MTFAPADPGPQRPRRLALRNPLPLIFRERPLAERMSALKERIYASFTGLAIVTIFALDPEHVTAQSAFVTLLAGIAGITLAGLVAEFVSHIVSHQALPTAAQARTMLRIAAGAVGSASIALISLFAAWAGLFTLHIALQVSVGIYLLTLALILLVAAHRTRLPWRKQLIALVCIIGAGAVVVAVLILAH